MTVICAISDLHGNLPENIIPEVDLLIIAGDICPCPRLTSRTAKVFYQSKWLQEKFAPWLDKQPVKHTVAVWGNHDWIGQLNPALVPRLPWTVLTDQVTEILGHKIYGSPWQLEFFDWAFNLPEEGLAKKWMHIPDGTDILVLHGPPYGFGDLASPMPHTGRIKPEHVGSPSLTKRLQEVRPRLTVYGHIHSGYGVYSLDDGIKLANVSLLNEEYKLVNKPFILTLE